MKCPNDQAVLVMSERHGIEIDYCPECRGVWLDRGELDKIIDRAGTAGQPTAAPVPAPAAPSYAPPQYAEPQYAEPQYRDQRSDHSYGQRPYKKKRENWLSELFD
ncbi:zf-TFIIB domain-containing protein [Leifsonia virtsii]|uniref:Zf-TFIIB domain-containing protein n=1 Tax=Leifsonia virtsii TaxID=3035915 RepID=A0ABT8IU79_9MICO|nr:zf-TFIIB domain-containing protein [Leifsonia virtsii]MDN4596333.1 zf-TFIIB domain-containing protein [Leifsonia virtsii]